MSRLFDFRFSSIDSRTQDDGLFLDDFVTPWGAHNLSSLVANPQESRVTWNRSLSVLKKTPILLRISSIPPKPWSESSILLVDLFTRFS